MGPLLNRKLAIKSLFASFRFCCGQELHTRKTTRKLIHKSVQRQQQPLFSGHNRDHLKTQDCVSTSRQMDLLGSILGNNVRCRGLAASRRPGLHIQVFCYFPPEETLPTGQSVFGIFGELAVNMSICESRKPQQIKRRISGHVQKATSSEAASNLSANS